MTVTDPKTPPAHSPTPVAGPAPPLPWRVWLPWRSEALAWALYSAKRISVPRVAFVQRLCEQGLVVPDDGKWRGEERILDFGAWSLDSRKERGNPNSKLQATEVSNARLLAL